MKSTADLKVLHDKVRAAETDYRQAQTEYERERQIGNGGICEVSHDDSGNGTTTLRRYQSYVTVSNKEAIFFRDALLTLYPLEEK